MTIYIVYHVICPEINFSLLIGTEDQKCATVRKQEVDALQKRVNTLQNELREEIRRNKFGDNVRQT